jgi:transposase
MEGWVKNWLDMQRACGKKGLEVKKTGRKHFVYHSKTYWDKTQHKKRKTSTYIGRLDKEHGLIQSGEEKPVSYDVRSVTQYGNSMLLHHVLDDLLPVLKEAFPNDWMELQAMAIVRTQTPTPLKSVRDEWELLYNRDGITPDLSPKTLSTMLKTVGGDRRAQDKVFNMIKTGRMLVYDLSCMYSMSRGVTMAEKGYNKDRVHAPQINLALVCSVDMHLPVMMRALPGSIRDIKTLYNTILEIGLEGKILILDRGFYSDPAILFLTGRAVDYIVPAKRNSHYYNEEVLLDTVFKYEKRLIHAGKKQLDTRRTVYLYEDQDLRLEEHKNLYDLLQNEKITRERYRESLVKSGRILILSNQDKTAEEIYTSYKRRDVIEKMFDDFKNTLDADHLYLQDDLSIHGHTFIAFLTLYMICSLQNLLKKAGLDKKYTPRDLLRQYKKTSHITINHTKLITETPKQVADIEKTLQLDIHPKKQKS